MAGTAAWRAHVARLVFSGMVAVAAAMWHSNEAIAVVVISDGFGDADRNNDGVIGFYDTDINDTNSWNDATLDAGLASRGIVEVTAAQDPSDTGIVWLGTRSYDTTANIPKSRLRIINDSVATGSETLAELHNDGLALSVDSRGGGSSFIGRFPQSVDVGPVAGDKLKVSVDFRAWKEATAATTPPDFNELRWGLYEDTDNELGTTAPYGIGAVLSPPGATVEWGKDDGNWFASQPGAEGDKGIRTNLTFGSIASPTEARINWEYNLNGINGTSNNGRILEGTGVTDISGSGGDTGTIANPTSVGDGPGGIIQGATYSAHTLSMEIMRLANGLIEVATFVDNVELLRDDIKDTDTGFAVLGPPAFSYDYLAFRNTADYDYVIDNFKLELFGSNATEGLPGDYNDNDVVDAADYTVWRDNLGSATSLPNDSTPGVTNDDYTLWKQNFGMSLPGSGGAVGSSAVPEPGALAMLVVIMGVYGFGPTRRKR
jgi:hypothetical protein